MKNILKEHEINLISEIALNAGNIAKTAFLKKNFVVNKKIDDSKVTSVDIEISNYISQQLSKNFPLFKIVCEEGNFRNVTNEEIFFLIDPIDGTSSFINDNQEFSINIALIKNNKPIFGLIYAPLFEGGKMIFNDQNNNLINFNLKNNSKEFLKNKNIKSNHIRIVTSARSKDEDIKNFTNQLLLNKNQYLVEKLSSAVKFIRILENESDLYIHFRKSMEWDTASGQILSELKGARVKNLFFKDKKFFIGEDLLYKKPQFINGAFIVDLCQEPLDF